MRCHDDVRQIPEGARGIERFAREHVERCASQLTAAERGRHSLIVNSTLPRPILMRNAPRFMIASVSALNQLTGFGRERRRQHDDVARGE